MRRFLAALLLALLPLPALAQGICPAPVPLTFEVSGQLRRDRLGFTQGLEFHGGQIYESTGRIAGTTRLMKLDPATGRTQLLHDAGQAYFGEGLTVFQDRLYQLSWQEKRVFVFDLNGRKLRELANPRDGWGLTNDGKRLIASDGSDRLFFHAPDSFATLGSVRVRAGADPVYDLNELEYADGSVWANVFQSWKIVRIAPATGCVEAVADLRHLYYRMSETDRRALGRDSGNYVLNGIARDPATGEFVLTGKQWPVLFRGRFVAARATP